MQQAGELRRSSLPAVQQERAVAASGAGRAWVALLLAAAMLLGLVSALRATQCWPNDSSLNHTSGVWTAMALDLAHGVFYRPLYGSLGYGGTRYFPLYFTLHAAGIRLLGNWRVAGHLLSASAFVLLVWGVYVLLRRLRVPRWLALGATTAVLAGASAQEALLSIRADGLAAALNIWGLVLCVRERTSSKGLYFAAVLFTLAFAAKQTTVFGMVAVVFTWALAREWRRAVRLLAASFAGYASVLTAIYIASHGRAWENMRLTATGGMALTEIPRSLITAAGTVASSQGAELVTPLLALGAWSAGSQALRRGVPAAFFLFSLLVTATILTSPGTDTNHLLDLHVASLLLFVSWIAAGSGHQGPVRLRFGVAVLAALMLFNTVLDAGLYLDDDREPQRSRTEQLASMAAAGDGKILTENPMVSIAAKQPPYVLDPFMFEVLHDGGRVPGFANALWQKLRNREFAAVVLMHDPDLPEWRNWYDGTHFGKGFIEELQKNYQRTRDVPGPGGGYVFQPVAPGPDHGPLP